MRKTAPLFSQHTFWNTQLVVTLNEEQKLQGEIKSLELKDVPIIPYPLPEEYKWVTIDYDTKDFDDVYVLLRDNYVDNVEGKYCLNYSPEFLKWALAPPGYHKEWTVGIRAKSNKQLIGFASAIPKDLSIDGKLLKLGCGNFFCIHSKHRSKRLTPILIQELIRRVNLKSVWQFFFSTSKVIISAFAESWYWERVLIISCM